MVSVALLLEHVDRDEGVVGDERRLEDGRSARVERLFRRGDPRGAGVVRQVDQHAARVARAGRFTHLAALVEQILQDLVGLELERVRLVHLPPELLVALEAGGETGLGEAGSLRSHGAKGSAGVGQEARGILGSGLALDSTRSYCTETRDGRWTVSPTVTSRTRRDGLRVGAP